jgi:hypothetical protein
MRVPSFEVTNETREEVSTVCDADVGCEQNEADYSDFHAATIISAEYTDYPEQKAGSRKRITASCLLLVQL